MRRHLLLGALAAAGIWSGCWDGAGADRAALGSSQHALVGELGLIRNINPGASSYPTGFAELGNKAYFVANDGAYGKELWSTDGTETGTTRVTDLNTGGDSNFYPLIASASKTPFLGTVAWTGATYELVRIKPGVSTERWPLNAKQRGEGGVVVGDRVLLQTRDTNVSPEVTRLWAFDDASVPVEIGTNVGNVRAAGDRAYPL
jgi:ELWxxDGT repeat protein